MRHQIGHPPPHVPGHRVAGVGVALVAGRRDQAGDLNNLGLAHALVTANLRQGRRMQIQAAELDVDENNVPAIHVYQDCGFELLFRILWYRMDLTA